MKKIVLIDGHSILHRAFFGIPDLTNAEGIHTNAVYGFLNIMFKILDEEKPDYLTVAFDAMGIVILEKEGYEADDILGTAARMAEEAGLLASVVSGDRDLLQLATERVKIRIPKTKRGGTEIEDYYAKDVKERYQVTPTQFIDVKALMGDASDNIPGVPGIGEKTATSLIAAYGSIEGAYAHLEEIKPKRAKDNLGAHYDMAQMSKELATIDVRVPLEYALQDALLGDFYTKEAYVICKRLELKQSGILSGLTILPWRRNSLQRRRAAAAWELPRSWTGRRFWARRPALARKRRPSFRWAAF